MAGMNRVAVLAIALLCTILMLTTANASAGEPETIYIAEGGHYAAGPFYYYDSFDLWVNMTVIEGGPVDVYIMTMAQYENSYPSGSEAPLAVSFKNASMENVTHASIHHSFNSTQGQYSCYGESIFVVIDNRHCDLTPNDASPTGHAKVLFQVDQTSQYYGFYDYEEDFFPFILCALAPIITIIVVVAIVILALRQSVNSRQPPMPPYPLPPVPPVM